ncbi:MULTISPECIES: NUMOD4 domain-containing protein [Staphylococcus]|uniref:NUMOD4 domain-containing protein n=3 Tax=Staphylococcus TaxID=1279 RepID=UPI0008A9A779|nr:MULTISPECIES: NUMOD4 domain-containing protein [Staphylococcus]MBM7132744.1 HNH endonuclease [Staphylococcus lugdunensis]MCH8641151.1 NUMOD4 motif-containing HNH endonuclease [Staphylococcus lugdunensis]MCH8644479.1 NUMOD4 motif-containing HNH endonuclease [Staphylococcus lugdunensis]MDK7860020.1 NUMOD4 domain-containing protein [Staphylococcus lugdunensis]MDK8288687.1 NUMOD4 domain-containing protein [Staphylococcus lugdunensis]
MNEIWKDIEGYEGLYEISNLGRVKSLPKMSGSCMRKEKILNSKNRLTKDGYARVNLHREGKGKDFRVCRLVATHFIDNPDNKSTVNHINGIKTDDRVENLEWATSNENMKHAYDTQLKKGMKGETNSQSKLTMEQVETIRKRYKRYSKTDGTVAIARDYGVTPRVINQIVNNKSYKID